MQKIPVRRLTDSPNRPSSPGMFKIREVASLLKGTDLIQPLHRHDFYFILALRKGKGLHEIDFSPYKITDNCVFILRPGQVHRLELRAGSTGYLVEFNAEFLHPINRDSADRLRKAGYKNFCKVAEQNFNKLDNCLKYMFHEFTGRSEGHLAIIKANIDIFLLELNREKAHPEPSTKIGSYTQERFEEFLDFLEQHIASRKEVAHYTQLMNLSSYQLNEICKTAVGKTPSRLINERIILEAKRHLLATSNQVKEIADQLGYEDVSYFIRFFRKHTGHSPEVFRTSLM
ncbi:MAG: helix-turn-helix domain-containing protein [Chitinophagaceae bacterium]|nr:helix-turn-helix domain-containing protein [Chitinophagaceae bacterium]